MPTSDSPTAGTGAAPEPTSGPRSDLDGRVLLLALVLFWPVAALLPLLAEAPPALAIPWIVAVTAACVRWTLYPTPIGRRAVRRARLRAGGIGRTWPWVLAAACATVIVAESSHLAYSRWFAQPAEPGELWEPYARRGPAYAAAVLLLLVGFAPMTEELALRGLVTRALEPRLGVAGAILGASVIFAAIHRSGWAFPQLLLAGVMLGSVAWGARSVWASAIAHATWNAFAFSQRLWPGRAAVLFAPVRTWMLTAVCLISAVLLGALVRRMRQLSGGVGLEDGANGDG